MEVKISLKDLEKYRNSFKKLKPYPQFVLLTSCVTYEPLGSGEFESLVQEIVKANSEIRKLVDTPLKSVLNSLTSDGWLEFSNRKYSCASKRAAEVIREGKNFPFFDSLVKIIQDARPRIVSYWYHDSSAKSKIIRDYRLALYRQDWVEFDKCWEDLVRHEVSVSILVNIFSNPLEPDLLLGLPDKYLARIIPVLSRDVFGSFADPREIESLLLQLLKEVEGPSLGPIRCVLAEIYFLKGDWEEAKKLSENHSDIPQDLARMAMLDFLQGKNEESVAGYASALKLLRKILKKRTIHISLLPGFFYALALLKTNDYAQLSLIKKVIKAGDDQNLSLSYHYLQGVSAAQEGDTHVAKSILDGIRYREAPFDMLLHALARHWTGMSQQKDPLDLLEEIQQKANESGLKWMDFEISSLLALYRPNESKFRKNAKKLQNELGIESLLHVVKREEPWKMALSALSFIGSGKKGTSLGSARLIWRFNFDDMVLSPIEQKSLKGGHWSKGRAVALKRIKNGALECMTSQDHQVGSHVREGQSTSYYYSSNQWELDPYQALEAMVGHPLVFLEESPNTNCEFVLSEPELTITQKGDSFLVKFPVSVNGGDLEVIRETPTRFRLVKISKAHKQIAKALGKTELIIPKKAKAELTQAIGNISRSVNVSSDLKDVGQQVKKVRVKKTLFAHILPSGAGFRLEVLQKPFGPKGPALKPGAGSANLIARFDGEPKQASRNLTEEVKKATDLIGKCPTLAMTDEGDFNWQFEGPEDCLEILLELDPLRSKKEVVLEWPEGEKLKLNGTASFEQLKLKVSKNRDWFGLSGGLELSDGKILEMKRLLELMDNAQGNFIEISDGQFIALTDGLRKKLNEARAYLREGKAGLQFHPLAAPGLEDFFEAAGELKAAKQWREQLDRTHQAMALKAIVPSTFKAELRDYQTEGYEWLSRLAHWGVGACLADDMGLGKTIQALAIILDRTEKGPTLVVAPASVTRNWQKEIARFTPTLKPMLFGAGDRQKVMEDLGPYDILMTSYGLMQQESEMMSKVEWSTIVLDEAQAIKNAATKRSKAAMTLNAGFKILTTGTPIENHLGELWNLFNFINPGLLGSLKDFNERFAIPIEKNNDKARKRQLQMLIKPFMLRRKKTQVLDELPPKTEITLRVKMSEDEATLYEAYRQKAVEDLESGEAKGGQQHLQILAEIMRLRRICCNPKLVLPDSKIEGSKLKVFSKLVEELAENGHKALVFSQFVGHLHLIREKIEEMGLSYQYLDGSTPMKKRQIAIDDFQAGKGDLFLISLKAGGTGLNLTAADYVIHMDPWWNPAVEDQASDRAHRIGQQRPVTIYRLIMEDSIEEKIVDLHSEKRHLADGLLEGTEASAKLSGKQLLQLIKGEYS